MSASMSRESSPFGEVRIQITTPAEETLSSFESPSPKLSFSVPLTSTVIPMEELVEEEKEEKEKKKARKSVDDTKTKRKDTATSLSFTNFFHRFTRSEKEEKHKSTMSIAEEEKVDRPDKLVLPEVNDGDWTELKTLGTDNFRTALDMGNETGMPIYEWKPDSLEETLLVEYAPGRNDLMQMDIDSSEIDDIEMSLTAMLDEFRSGNMRSFSDEQLLAMLAAKEDHEAVTNLHLALYSLDDEGEGDIESRQDALCQKLAEKMISMHNRLADFVPAHHS